VHSLQTFELARGQCPRIELIAAALLHDVGKSQAIVQHATIGATMLRDFLPPSVVWLVEHHMDLLHYPQRTNRALKNSPKLQDLKLLRQWDIQGRVPNSRVCSVDFAVNFICDGLDNS